MSVTDHSSCNHRSHPFWSQTMPEAGSYSFLKGFKVEKVSSLVQRILSHVDQGDSTTAFLDAFDEALIQRIQTSDKTEPGSLDFEVEVYETLKHALQQTFESALYSGKNDEYRGRNLFTRERAHVEATSVAGSLVHKLFSKKLLGKFKHEPLLLRLKTLLENRLHKSIDLNPHHSAEVKRRIKDTSIEQKKGLHESSTLTDKNPHTPTNLYERSFILHTIIKEHNPLQWRVGVMEAQAQEMLTLADRLCLTSITNEVLRSLRELPENETLKGLKLLELADKAKNGSKTDYDQLCIYISQNREGLETLILRAQSSLKGFPHFHSEEPLPSAKEIDKLLVKFKETKIGSQDHVKLSNKLSQILYLLTFQQLQVQLNDQIKQLQSILESYDRATRSTATTSVHSSDISDVLSSSPIIASELGNLSRIGSFSDLTPSSRTETSQVAANQPSSPVPTTVETRLIFEVTPPSKHKD